MSRLSTLYTFFLISFLLFVSIVSAQPLTGIKTIGGTNPDYPTIHAAICSLNVHGTATPGVTFLIRGGTYNEPPDSIVNVQGTSTNARVVFRPADTVGVVVYKFLNSNARFGFKLIGSDFIVFDGNPPNFSGRCSFTISTSNTYCFCLTDGSDYCCIKNLIVYGRGMSTVYSTHNQTILAPTCNNDTIMGCTLQGAYYSVSVLEGTGWVISNNRIKNFSSTGIQYYSGNNVLIYQNVIYLDTASHEQAVYGIDLEYPGNVRVDANLIYNLETNNYSEFSRLNGIYLYSEANTTIDSTKIISNNMINLEPQNTGIVCGINQSNGICKIINNTIRIAGVQDTIGASYGLSIDIFNLDLSDTIANNVLINERRGRGVWCNQYCFYPYTGSHSFTFCDNNIISTGIDTSSDNTFAVGCYNQNYNTLSDVHSDTSYHGDSHSLSNFPTFVNPPDLHIDPSIPTPVERAGIPFSCVRYDFDGDLRDSLHPDIGADEGNFTPLSVKHESVSIPSEFSLSPIYPNPFNSTATIHFSLPITSNVKSEVFDITGRKVTTLINGRFNAGFHQTQFDGSKLASGIYLVRMSNGHTVVQQKMVLLK